MIRAFSGDPFLAGRAFRAAVAEAATGGADVRRLGEGSDADALREACSQGGLFGAVVVALDLDEAFAGAGAAATSPRNAMLDAMEGIGDAELLVLDAASTPARQKRYRRLGELRHEPAPRFGALERWVQGELRVAGLETQGDVAGTLVDLFGEDLAAIASEVTKLAALGGTLDPERVRTIANRPASRSAFDMMDAVAAGDAATALRVARGLLDAGESPLRVMAAVAWQLDLVAGCVALEEGGGLGVDATAAALGAKAYPTRKALAVAARLDETTLAGSIDTFVAADERMKRGGGPAWVLEACTLTLARAFRQSRSRSNAASKRRSLPGKSSPRQ